MTNRRFPPPWSVDRPHPDSFVVKDANGIVVATVHCRDDLQKWTFGHSKLTSDEARGIAKAIARIPEFMMGRRGFYARGPGNYRWSMARPFHVAFEDGYVRQLGRHQRALQIQRHPLRCDRRENSQRRPLVRLSVRAAA
jgi:hypothetical protein